ARALRRGVRGSGCPRQARGLRQPLRAAALRAPGPRGYGDAGASRLEGAGVSRLRRRPARTPARGRDAALDARLAHPVFAPLRPWLEALGPEPSLEALNAASERAGLRTESGRPVRFVAPGDADPYYEVHVFESGRVPTRRGRRHGPFTP